MPYLLGSVKPHTRAAAEEIGGKFGIRNVLGIGARVGDSDHPKGLALDFMTTDVAKGNALASYVQANAARLGVTYVIWYRRIWNASRANDGWRPMPNRGSRTANHEDHVHVSFSATGSGQGSADPAGFPNLNPLDGINVLREKIDSLIGTVQGLVNVGNAMSDAVASLLNPQMFLRYISFVAGLILVVIALVSWDKVSSIANNAQKAVSS